MINYIRHLLPEIPVWIDRVKACSSNDERSNVFDSAFADPCIPLILYFHGVSATRFYCPSYKCKLIYVI